MINCSIWGVLGFIALGMLINKAYEYYAWLRYNQGRRDGLEQKRPNGGGRQ